MGNKEKTVKKAGVGKKSQKLKGKRKVSKTDKEANKQVDKVEGVKLLVSKYGMTNIDALIEYEKFFKKYPSGLINKEQFLEEYKENFMAEGLFRVFDETNRGALTFFQFMTVKTAPKLVDPSEKLSWVFNAFDEDGGGTIEYDEITKLVEALYRMSGRGDCTETEEDKEEIILCVDEVIESIDVDGDGVITREEFVENALKSDFIQEIIEMGPQ